MLIITGSVAFDYIMDFPGMFSDHILAGKEHNINLSFIVNKFARRRGGTAGNVSFGLGLLKTKHILFSTAGMDFNSYKKEFEELGIVTKYIQIDEKQYTATGFAVTDKKDNQIWGYFYGAAEQIADLKLRNVAKKSDLVLIGPSGAKGSMSMIKQCISLGFNYMFDPGFILTQVDDRDLKIGVQNCSYLIGNDYEIALIQKRIPGFKKIIKDKTLITTLGKKGALIQTNNGEIFIKAARPEKVVDPTGAGDAWRAGFLAGLTREFDLKTCAGMGSVLASFCIEQYGTQEYKFTKAGFTKRYQETYNTVLDL
jgi:adenosine kinase